REFCAMLEAYDWPGNVRELRSAVDRFVVLGKEAGDLFAAGHHPASDSGLVRLAYTEAREIVLERFERNYVDETLAQADGVVTRAAELAGLTRQSFYRILDRVRAARGQAPDDE